MTQSWAINQHLLSTYHVPGSVLDPGNTVMNSIKCLSSRNSHAGGEIADHGVEGGMSVEKIR